MDSEYIQQAIVEYGDILRDEFQAKIDKLRLEIFAPRVVRLWDTYERTILYVRADQILEVQNKSNHHGAKSLVRLACRSDPVHVSDETAWVLKQVGFRE